MTPPDERAGRDDAPLWTTPTLYLHLTDKIQHVEARLDAKINANDHLRQQVQIAAGHAIDTAMSAAEKAHAIAAAAIERRLVDLNELRGVVTDQQENFMSRTEGDLRLTTMAARISTLESQSQRSEGKGAGLNTVWLMLVGAAAVIAAALDVLRTLGK